MQNNTSGVPYSQQAWIDSYIELRDALERKDTEISKSLLRNGCKVNSSNRHCNAPLHFATNNGDLETIQMLLNRKANMYATNSSGLTALHIATLNNNTKVINLFLKYKMNVNIKDRMDGQTPLHIAVVNGYSESVEVLLKHRADANAAFPPSLEFQEYEQYAPLHIAVIRDNIKILQMLLRSGVNVNIEAKNCITPLHIASEKGIIHIVRDLLNYGANIRSVCTSISDEGYTPLHFACKQGREEVLALFLSKGADVNVRTKDDSTPLHIAIKNEHEKIVQLLLQNGADVDIQNKDGNTILYLAVEKGNTRILENVLKYKPDVNDESNRKSIKFAVECCGENYHQIIDALFEYGISLKSEDAKNIELLHAAVKKGYSKIIEEQLKCGLDVSALHISTSKEGFTPLHSAAKHKQENVVKLLLNREVDIYTLDSRGKTPVYYAVESNDINITKLLLAKSATIKDSLNIMKIAVENGSKEIVEILLDHGVDVNTTTPDGRVALHFLVVRSCWFTEENHVSKKKAAEVAKLLLRKGANVDSQMKCGTTALHQAATHGYTEVVKILLEYNANVDCVDTDGNTALYLATRLNHVKIVALLLKCCANVDCKRGRIDSTPLHAAAYEGFAEIVYILLNYGADVYGEDKYGRTALHLAAREGHDDAVKVLLKYGSNINSVTIDGKTPNDYVSTGIKCCDYRHDAATRFHLIEEEHIESYSVPSISKYHIVRQMFIKEEVKMEVALRPSKFFFTDDPFEKECKNEIMCLKNYKIDNDITLHDILTTNLYRLAIYTNNENVVDFLNLHDYKSIFPIYASTIKNRFNFGIELRKYLIIFSKCFNVLPYICIETIFSFLSIIDLKNLIKACRPVTDSYA